jgi:hypothetical protein
MKSPLKPIVAVVLAIAMGLLISGCAGTGPSGNASNPGDSSGASSGDSGVTMFGTIDVGVSSTRNGGLR